MESRNRGRSKGRGQTAQASRQRPGPQQSGGPVPTPGQPGPAGVWNRPPLPQQSQVPVPQAGAHWVRPQLPPPTAVSQFLFIAWEFMLYVLTLITVV